MMERSQHQSLEMSLELIREMYRTLFPLSMTKRWHDSASTKDNNNMGPVEGVDCTEP